MTGPVSIPHWSLFQYFSAWPLVGDWNLFFEPFQVFHQYLGETRPFLDFYSTVHGLHSACPCHFNVAENTALRDRPASPIVPVLKELFLGMDMSHPQRKKKPAITLTQARMPGKYGWTDMYKNQEWSKAPGVRISAQRSGVSGVWEQGLDQE